ncbi:MAG: DUF2380 domain-containing protein [Methylovulum sp.]|nr:MAG: DUF2380 domain-containing protein [Methylovulum sp.]
MKYYFLPGLLVILLLLSGPSGAGTPIAVLDFELNDITSLPNTPAERIRTASIKPLLEEALAQRGAYQIIPISPAAQEMANSGFGYLFRFDEQAVKLGEQSGADWVIVSQHSKPSFLFSYLMAHLIDVKAKKRVADFDIELKGNHEIVTRHAVKRLAGKIDGVISGNDKNR